MSPHRSPELHVVRGLATLACLLALPSGVNAQASLATGSSLYSSSEFCLESPAFLTDFQASARGGLIGASVSYHNSSWPWPTPPTTGGRQDRIDVPPRFGGAAFQESVFLSHGEAARAVIEVFALPLLDRLGGGEGRLAELDRRISPFVGVGVQYSTDGKPAPANGRGAETYGVKGSTDLLLVAGASLVLPLNDRTGVLFQLRGNTLFASDTEFELPSGEIITAPGSETRTWAQWLVGLSFDLGG